MKMFLWCRDDIVVAYRVFNNKVASFNHLYKSNLPKLQKLFLTLKQNFITYLISGWTARPYETNAESAKNSFHPR